MKSDPDLYDFAPYRNRAPIRWPGDKQVAVWIAPNLEYYEIDPPAHPRRKIGRASCRERVLMPV